MAALSTLERRIDRHIKESTEQIQVFKTDLQTLKGCSKLKFKKSSVQSAKPEITVNSKAGVKGKSNVKTDKDSRKLSVRYTK